MPGSCEVGRALWSLSGGEEVYHHHGPQALEALHTSRRLTGHLVRWALTLQQYSYDVQYKSGAKHQNVDGLSRQSWEEDEDTKTEQPTRTWPLQAGGDVEGPSYRIPGDHTCHPNPT